jgi:hypothetical protein
VLSVKLSLGLPLVVVALVAGFVLGGVGPRRELARTRLEVASLGEQLSRGTSQPSPLSLLLPVPELQCPEPGAPSLEQCEQLLDAKQVASAPGEEREMSVVSSSVTVAEEGSEIPQSRARSREATRERIEVLRNAQLARVRQTRAALQEQAGLSSREMDEVDGITREMNSALARSTAVDLLAQVAMDRTPTSLEMLGAATQVSAILYEGQAALEGLVGPSISGVDRSARDIFNYIEIPQSLLELRILDSEPASAGEGTKDSDSPGDPGSGAAGASGS